jgi:hypothetical protein
MVTGDQQGSDALAGKGGSKSQISRACHCPYEDGDDMEHECVWKTKKDMMKLVEHGGPTFETQLKKSLPYSQVPVDNVFWKLQFMDEEHSILGSTPTCLLHLMLQGLFVYVGENIIEPLSPDIKNVLDDLCRALIPMLRQSGSKNNFPRCQFKNGITGLSQITADGREGVIFVLVILFSLPRFNIVTKREIFDRHPDKFPKAKARTVRKNYAFVCELLLITY